MMADEAFALSPINARAAMPSDADYDAIREAFMETSRGRWFLSEYTKRNRNADTRMVLDAVARIEQTLAAQKQPNGSSALGESLVAIHAIVGEARAEVARAIAGLGNDAVLTAACQGARIIREVSWTLRECGADVRICNLLDNQVGAIEAGQRLVSEIDRDGVLAAFDGLLDRVHDLAGEARPQRAQPAPASEEPTSPADDGDLSTAIAAAPSMTAAHSEPASETAPAAPTAEPLSPDPALTIITGTATDELEFVEAGGSQPPSEAATATPETFSADGPEPTAGEIEDVDSVLDLVALEMSAPQPDEPSELEAAIETARIELERADAAERADAQRAELAQHIAAASPDIEQLVAEVATPHEAVIETSDAVSEVAVDATSDETSTESASLEEGSAEIQSFELGERGEPLYATQPGPGAVRMPEPVMAAAPLAAAPAVTPAPAASAAGSLGAALLASGVVGHPGPSRGDALAPLRRMSQPEKIAFFS